jgi:hypothetical protein
MAKWTREEIIREILRRESAGLTLTTGRKTGVDSALYQAAKRVFGSWPLAVAAAGVSPDHAISHDRWPPAKILASIRALGRRQRPIRPAELRGRYANLIAAARRVFDTWTKAVVAAGVDPAKLRCTVPWTRDRIIEEILTRALRNEPLASRTVKPRVLADYGARLFGSWGAALAAAGIDPTPHVHRWPKTLSAGKTLTSETAAPIAIPRLGEFNPSSAISHRPGQVWSNDAVICAILFRLQDRRPLNAKAVYRDDRPLYRAATRRHGNWHNALIACGLNPDEHRLNKPRSRTAS